MKVGLKGVFEVTDYDSSVECKKVKMADPIWRTIFLIKWKIVLKVGLKGVFEVTDYDSSVESKLFKMAEPIW